MYFQFVSPEEFLLDTSKFLICTSYSGKIYDFQFRHRRTFLKLKK